MLMVVGYITLVEPMLNNAFHPLKILNSSYTLCVFSLRGSKVGFSQCFFFKKNNRKEGKRIVMSSQMRIFEIF